jgi:hypothetical protein
MKKWMECDIYDFITFFMLLFLYTIFYKYRFLWYSQFENSILWLVFECAGKLLVIVFPVYPRRGTFLGFPQAERIKWIIHVSHFTSSSSVMFYTDHRSLKSVVFLWAPSVCWYQASWKSFTCFRRWKCGHSMISYTYIFLPRK